jgi:pimeloyl-ACP methyl ester carboxylesterase
MKRINVERASVRTVQNCAQSVYYREAGPADAPVVLLLHGFPTSSFQFRKSMPRLAGLYRVIGPDLPVGCRRLRDEGHRAR